MDTALYLFIPRQRRGVFLCINGINGRKPLPIPRFGAGAADIPATIAPAMARPLLHGTAMLKFSGRMVGEVLSIPEFLTVGRISATLRFREVKAGGIRRMIFLYLRTYPFFFHQRKSVAIIHPKNTGHNQARNPDHDLYPLSQARFGLLDLGRDAAIHISVFAEHFLRCFFLPLACFPELVVWESLCFS